MARLMRRRRQRFPMNRLRSGSVSSRTPCIRRQPRAGTWWYSWIAGYSAGAVVQGSLAIAHWNDVKPDKGSPNALKVRDRRLAEDMLVGSATFALGVGGLLINPFLPATSAKKSAAHVGGHAGRAPNPSLCRPRNSSGDAPGGRRIGRGWGTHLLNIGANAAAGLVTVLAFHRKWSDGLITFAAGETRFSRQYLHTAAPGDP